MNRYPHSERLFCSATDCLEEAVVIGRATLEVGTLAAASEREAHQTFSLPLCAHHAHLLSFAARLVSFDTGMPPSAAKDDV